MPKLYHMSGVPLIQMLLAVLLLVSCKSEVEKDQEAASKAHQRFQNIDITAVDVFPQFEDCDEMESTADCFYAHLHDLIKKRLTADTLSMNIKSKDSLVATFTVTDEGMIQYDSIAHSAQHLDRAFMDSILKSKLMDLPKIDSALKQGIPVSSSYLVPVVVLPIGEKTGQ